MGNKFIIIKLPIIFNYIFVLILPFVVTIIISEVVYRIPRIRFLFGIKNNINSLNINK
ncbi:hypothetical protein CDIOL_18010 [Clostridium diolis]|uniref:Uncharacterized protein n=1 Tax=Clostridium diolis TaxID=223919 RepID=A0AAV3VZF5_9CLOT|nr:hypothetical protein CDIOL_18010 [Clostridium diolis]